jgi:spore maturation protein SpmA
MLFATSVLAVSLQAMMPLTQAATPWAMIASRATGRVEKLGQPPKDDQSGFDVATVVLNAGAAKVYATTVGMLRKNQQVHGTTED